MKKSCASGWLFTKIIPYCNLKRNDVTVGNWTWATIMQYFRTVNKFADGDYYLRHMRPSLRPSVRVEQLGSHRNGFLRN